jgi:thiol:disulfide interchange protein DsbC
MLKLLSSLLLLSYVVHAEINKDLLMQYVKNSIVKHPKIIVKDVTVLEERKDEPLKDWSVLFGSVKAEVEGNKAEIPFMFFISGNIVTTTLTNFETGIAYNETIVPTFPENEIYSEKHLLFGNKDAKHKLVIFSDPQCPFCMKKVPEIMRAVKANPTQMALYYYHLPLLAIHPVSDVLTRVMYVAQQEKKLDIVEKIYSLEIDARLKDTDKILKIVKEHTGYSVSKEKIDAKEVKDALAADQKMANRLLVRGTPAVYIDGKLDKSRNKYKTFMKK